MAQLLRTHPPRPHLAKAVVSPGKPVVPGSTVVTWKRWEEWLGNDRIRITRAHLAKPIVAPGGPVIPGSTVKLVKGTIKPVGHRVVGPVIVLTPAFAPNNHLYTQKLTIKPVHRLLPGPIVSPGKAVIPGSTVKFQKLRITVPNRAKLAGPTFAAPVVVFNPPPPIVHLQRLLIRPVGHRIAPAIVSPGGPVVPGAMVRLARLLIRPVRHLLASPVVSPGRPIVPGATIIGQARKIRDTVGRGGHARLAKPLVGASIPPNTTTLAGRVLPVGKEGLVLPAEKFGKVTPTGTLGKVAPTGKSGKVAPTGQEGKG